MRDSSNESLMFMSVHCCIFLLIVFLSPLAPSMIQVHQPTFGGGKRGGGGGGADQPDDDDDPEAIERQMRFAVTVVLRSLHGLFQSV